MKSQRSKSFPTTRNPFLNDTLIAVVGSIYWLDQKNNHDVELLRSYDLDDGFYDHPVVVISTDPGREEALVFVLVSLEDKNLQDISDSLDIRRCFLPISPATNPDNGIQLFLHSGAKFSKTTYVKAKNPFILSWRHLSLRFKEKNDQRYRLQADSLRALLACADSGLPPRVQRPQKNILSTTASRIPSLRYPKHQEVNRLSRYNLDFERSGGSRTLIDWRNRPIGSRSITLLDHIPQRLAANPHTPSPFFSYGTSPGPARNLTRGISYPQSGSWTVRSPLISPSDRLYNQEPYIGLPNDPPHHPTTSRSRCNFFIVLLFVLVILTTLGYLFLTETKSEIA